MPAPSESGSSAKPNAGPPRAKPKPLNFAAMTARLLLIATIITLVLVGTTRADDTADEAKRRLTQLDHTLFENGDREAVQLLKREPIERDACQGRWMENDEHCAVYAAITHQLKDLNWCEPLPNSLGQPYQHQWHKCSFTIWEQLIDTADTCQRAVSELSPSQAAELCRRLGEQALKMCQDPDAPSKPCWDTPAEMFTKSNVLDDSTRRGRPR